MTKTEAWQDLQHSENIILKVKYACISNATEFLFKPGNHDEQQFYSRVNMFIAGAESWELTKELKSPKIRIRDRHTGEDLN